MAKFSPVFLFALAVIITLTVAGCSDSLDMQAGSELFSRHCASCHPDGANTVTAAKTLRAADLKARGIITTEDIVEQMRNPGPGMPKFTEAVIPEHEALQIAGYVLKSFR
jgi:cytochrome c6